MIFGHDLWMLCKRFCLLGSDIDEDPERISISKTFVIEIGRNLQADFLTKASRSSQEPRKHISSNFGKEDFGVM